MSETRTIRLHLENDRYDIQSAEILLLPIPPPPELMARLSSGEQLQLKCNPVNDNLAEVSVFEPGRYMVNLVNVVFREKHGEQRVAVAGLALPVLTLTRQDLETAECHIRVPSSGKLRVTLVDNEGQILAYEQFGVLPKTKVEAGSYGCRTDETGNSVFDVPVGEYVAVVRDGESREVSVRNDFEEVTVTLRRPGRSCLVTVVGADGQPVRSARVNAVLDTKPQEVHSRPTDAHGHALFAGLDAGTYTFELADQPSRPGSVTIDGFDQGRVVLVAE